MDEEEAVSEKDKESLKNNRREDNQLPAQFKGHRLAFFWKCTKNAKVCETDSRNVST